jgi:cytochrome c biogenesis protein CcmG, thiol:disulfide interchange protein DsbE
VPEPRSRVSLIALIAVGGAALLVLLLVLFVPLGGVAPGAAPGASVESISVPGHPLVGKPAPEIELTTIDGEAFRLSDLRGHPVLLNFWATWCPPCRDEFPLMVKAYAAQGDDGLRIVGVLHDDFADGARRFAADMGATWPIVDDPDDRAFSDFVVPGLPTSYFIDEDGIVRAFSFGGFTKDGLAAQLETILPGAGDEAPSAAAGGKAGSAPPRADASASG